MGMSTVKLTPLSPVSLQLLSVASLHLPAITANDVPLIIHHVNRIESLKVSLNSLEWPAKRATSVSADTSNRWVPHRPRGTCRNAALPSSTFRTAPLTITSRHEEARHRVSLRNFQSSNSIFNLVYPDPSERSQGYLKETTALQFVEETGATRRIRTADLLITKNSQAVVNLTHPEKPQKK